MAVGGGGKCKMVLPHEPIQRPVSFCLRVVIGLHIRAIFDPLGRRLLFIIAFLAAPNVGAAFTPKRAFGLGCCAGCHHPSPAEFRKMAIAEPFGADSNLHAGYDAQ